MKVSKISLAVLDGDAPENPLFIGVGIRCFPLFFIWVNIMKQNPSTASKLVNDSRVYLTPGCMVVELPPTLVT